MTSARPGRRGRAGASGQRDRWPQLTLQQGSRSACPVASKPTRLSLLVHPQTPQLAPAATMATALLRPARALASTSQRLSSAAATAVPGPIVIIGGGAMGSASAHWIAKRVRASPVFPNDVQNSVPQPPQSHNKMSGIPESLFIADSKTLLQLTEAGHTDVPVTIVERDLTYAKAASVTATSPLLPASQYFHFCVAGRSAAGRCPLALLAARCWFMCRRSATT